MQKTVSMTSLRVTAFPLGGKTYQAIFFPPGNAFCALRLVSGDGRDASLIVELIIVYRTCEAGSGLSGMVRRGGQLRSWVGQCLFQVLRGRFYVARFQAITRSQSHILTSPPEASKGSCRSSRNFQTMDRVYMSEDEG
jgi:hypothetical protein